MNSNSQSANSPDTYSQRLADIVGTMIALLTLTLPVFIIAHYSSPDVQKNQQTLNYKLSHREEVKVFRNKV
jgi:lipopolysaccharide/colanic/teichoic acid biosynthesis glycosyltransferase